MQNASAVTLLVTQVGTAIFRYKTKSYQR